MESLFLLSRRFLFAVDVVVVDGYRLLVRRLLVIGVEVKMIKEGQVAELMRADPKSKSFGEIAFALEEHLEAVDGGGHELNHLESGEVLFPPEKLLDPGTHGGQQIIRVHDHVDERIEKGKETGVTAANVAKARPQNDWQQSVVVQVEDGQVSVLFAQDKKESIEIVDKFGHEKTVADDEGPSALVRVRVVDGSAENVVAAKEPAAHAHLVKEPRVEDDLVQVVDHEDPAQLERFPVGHESRPGHLDQVIICAADEQGREGRVH